MKRLIHQLQESLGVKQKVDQDLLADLLIHCIASGKTLKDAYTSLMETMGCEYVIDIDIVDKVAQRIETIILLDNDRAISLWARLIATYTEHLNDSNLNKVHSVTILNEVLTDILTPGDTGKGKYKSAFSRARNSINKAIHPRRVTLVCQVHKDSTVFTFVSAQNKDMAHNLLVSIGCTALATIDKILAQMGFHEEIL